MPNNNSLIIISSKEFLTKLKVYYENFVEQTINILKSLDVKSYAENDVKSENLKFDLIQKITEMQYFEVKYPKSKEYNFLKRIEAIHFYQKVEKERSNKIIELVELLNLDKIDFKSLNDLIEMEHGLFNIILEKNSIFQFYLPCNTDFDLTFRRNISSVIANVFCCNYYYLSNEDKVLSNKNDNSVCKKFLEILTEQEIINYKNKRNEIMRLMEIIICKPQKQLAEKPPYIQIERPQHRQDKHNKQQQLLTFDFTLESGVVGNERLKQNVEKATLSEEALLTMLSKDVLTESFFTDLAGSFTQPSKQKTTTSGNAVTRSMKPKPVPMKGNRELQKKRISKSKLVPKM